MTMSDGETIPMEPGALRKPGRYYWAIVCGKVILDQPSFGFRAEIDAPEPTSIRVWRVNGAKVADDADGE
jgi:hypothetical protein